ncbi:MAG TPA: hypothetical protein PKH02_03485 [Bacteroidales bacterium]|nr:hypothetical protein [Bacteroidales bacterium]HPT11068.1 hypothetical protein [Bacteroidales bacterium]
MNVNQIKENLSDPEELERLYHKDKRAFESEFSEIESSEEAGALYRFWKIRLDYDKQAATTRIPAAEITAMIIACIVAAILIKLPAFLDIYAEKSMFYERNAALIAALGISLFISWSQKVTGWKYLIYPAVFFIVPAIYINLLPQFEGYRSINLAYIYLPLMLWCIYGIIYMGFDVRDIDKRSEYIRYNGDLAILTGLIMIALLALSAITIALFNVIGINVQKLYQDTILIVGAISSPIVAAFIIRNYPFVTNKLAPVIATIFSPIVLITLIIYLFTVIFTGKDPFNDRDFLMVINLMLIGVMGVIVFSVSEVSVSRRKRFNSLVIFILAVVTALINILALSAIFYRLGEFGISSNRVAVMVSNLLIFINLILITIDLYKVNFRKAEITRVEVTIAKYLPVYFLWTIIVVFSFPLIFGAG